MPYRNAADMPFDPPLPKPKAPMSLLAREALYVFAWSIFIVADCYVYDHTTEGTGLRTAAVAIGIVVSVFAALVCLMTAVEHGVPKL